MVHGGQKTWKIAQNGRICAHSCLGQMRHMPDLDRSVPKDLVSSHMCPTYLLGIAQLLRYWEWQGRQVSP